MIIELGLIREPSGIKTFGSTFYSSGEVREAFKKGEPAGIHIRGT